jgi:hypothetical protein
MRLMAVAAAPVQASPAHCVDRSSGEMYRGRGHFVPFGGNGSFSLTPLDQPSVAGANPFTRTILAPGKAEVRGLTSSGIHSRWGRPCVQPTIGPAGSAPTFRSAWTESSKGSAPAVAARRFRA